MPDQSLASARLTIDLTALTNNWRAIAAHVGSEAKTAAVVKGDGYGCGVAEVGAALHAAGCGTFFVATPDEGLRLRAVAPGAAIYILAGLIPGSSVALIAADLRPVLNSLPEIEEWAAAKRAGAPTGSAIHIDTGMNRLGLTAAAAHALDRSLVAAIAPSLVMSHLVVSEVAANPLNRAQLDAFRAVAAAFPGIPASLANSAGVFLGRDYHIDLVRPGIALYGASPGDGVPVPMHVVVTAEARVLMVRDGQPGETVGYGATRRLSRATRIAILGAGYADGYHRIASGEHARVHLRGKTAPILGRVSMDLIAVDVTDIPGATRGDWAELFGPHLPVDEAAATAGTVGYEFLTGLGHRYARRYV